jgi:hypothetical protein
VALPAIRKDAMNTQHTPNRAARAGFAAVAVVGLVILLGGALLVGVHASKRDGDGFYASGAHRLGTPTRALVSDGLDVSAEGAGWLFHRGRLATIRVTARGTASKPIFVGIARKKQVAAYLRGVARDEISDLELNPFSVERKRHVGAAVPPTPTDEHFWSTSASGTGSQAIRWPVQEGNWAVVVMNADASAGVRTRIGVGAKVPAVLWVGIGALVVGASMLGGAGLGTYRSVQRPRRESGTKVTARTQPGVGGGS